MKSLGLDIGSTTIKGAVLNLETNRIETPVSKPFPSPIPGLTSGWMEISPNEILDQVHQVISMLLDTAPEATRVYFSGQMGGVTLVNDKREPLSNYLSWRDQRSLDAYQDNVSYVDSIRQTWPENVFTALGKELQPGSTISLLYWLSKHNQLPQEAIPTSIADFVISHLCQIAPRMHVTHAIGMLDHRVSNWHREAFALLGLDNLRLPELSHNEDCVGEFTFRERSLKVHGAYGDQQCALLGAGLQRDELSLNISTGSQVSRRVPQFEPGTYTTRKYFAGDWLNTMTHLPAGRSLNVLVDLLNELALSEGITLKNPWETIIRKAAQIQDNDLGIDLAFFSGPLGSRGSITQITTENLTVGRLFHAAFRSMADNYARCADRLDSKRSWKSVVLSGGLTQAVPQLRQMIQERFTVPIRESVGEETLMGLLQIAKEQEK